MSYRSDIDGLRAIAILIVVLYHANVPGIGGGFVGVDVFFVISGYLIIGLLCREFEQTGDLSLFGFFERRIRRLAPALILVLTATLILGAIYLTPINGEQQGLAKSAIATVALVSNLYFARHTGGYFDGPAEAQPLLHTWSLSVEEQFYLFWPLVVLAAGRYALRRGQPPLRVIRHALLLLFVLSLLLSLWWTSKHAQSAFFAAPTRAWEFAVGGLLFFALRDASLLTGTAARFGGIVAATGMVAIAYAATNFHGEMAFPGHLAAVPVFGAAAVIVGCAMAPDSPIARSLSWRPMAAIGLVSYAWYLWHWPLLAIARVHTLGEIGALGIAGVCVLSLVLASLTFRFVEAPIRQRSVRLMSTRRRAFGAGAVSVVAIAVLSAALGAYAKTIASQESANIALASALADLRKVQLKCWQSRPYSGALLVHPECNLPQHNGSPRILVWGDSHASHLVPVLETIAKSHDTAVRVRFMPECPPLLDYSPTLIGIDRSPGCEQFNRDVLAEVFSLRAEGLATVVIAARWWAYLQNHASEDAAIRGLQATLDALEKSGVAVLVAAPLPEFPHDVPACLARRSVAECSVDRALVEEQRARTIVFLGRASAVSATVTIVDPLPAVCNTISCTPMGRNGVSFSDSHHLTEAGSQLLLPLYAPKLELALSRDDLAAGVDAMEQHSQARMQVPLDSALDPDKLGAPVPALPSTAEAFAP